MTIAQDDRSKSRVIGNAWLRQIKMRRRKVRLAQCFSNDRFQPTSLRWMHQTNQPLRMNEHTELDALRLSRPLSYWPLCLVAGAAVIGSAVLVGPNQQAVPDEERGAPIGKVSVQAIDRTENIMMATPMPAVQPVSALALTERATVLTPDNTGPTRVNGS